MPKMIRRLIALAAILFVSTASAQEPDPLPSWNDGASKQAIVDFVTKVTEPESADYVPIKDRVATFDNDGTLWLEQPMYTQLAFALDRVKQLAPEHPEWKDTQPFKAVLEGDMKALAASGEKGIAQLVAATHAGMSPAEFQQIVGDWLATAKDKRFERGYTKLVYQPMLELLAYLRDKGFTTYIVSGGGIEFVRNFSEPVYGIPPAQVVGSSIKTKYEIVDGKPTLIRLPEVDFIDDKDGKPVGINQHIGQRPIAAFGNSDGDYQMLDWTTAGEGARLGLIVHHTDAEREYAYDRESTFGRLDKALDDAPAKGWIVVDMKNDWKDVFPPEN
ncbi:haloacid dehalogenase [Methyloceanibacter marginalis]|jgi:haloacid dehalogenase-like hydrolase|uniref:Haloacid dehalogenase n=1 Tax=Methyloceanibacter marginalis TaxID=1774971 RepID=A0A1E3WE20_9HYPH|nr:HAD family hydrolase [Methyloceanibacter marginalis]ODS04053.1 haloacid dehalogenase [Methyloceanibacter marginalis]